MEYDTDSNWGTPAHHDVMPDDRHLQHVPSSRSRNPTFDHIPEDVRRSDQNSRIERLDRMSRGRRKQYRWGVSASENKIAKAMNLPSNVAITLTPEQLEAYALHFRIEEITQKLKLNDVVPADAERSPSPTPQYDNMGKRTNTRDVRYRNKLQMERHKLVQRALLLVPNYKPPSDYRKPQKMQEKIYIPAKDYPEINFIGLIIGPRGNTLKKMESESGAKIAIRGKGSVKEGKGRSDVPHQQSMDDDLHCLVIADDESKIQKAIDLINKIIETAASTPEEKNELKRGQLRELASLNGTLRDDESTVCQNCGEPGHKKYECPTKKNFTATIKCHVCGELGHLARDCKKRPSAGFGNSYRSNKPNQQMPLSAADKEYEKLMLELGTGSASNNDQLRLTDYDEMDHNSPHPRDGPGAPWQRNQGHQQNNGGPPPWQKRNNDGYGNNNHNNNYQGRDYRDKGDNGRYGNDNYNNRNNYYDKRGNDRHGGYDADRGRFGNRSYGPDSYDRRNQFQHNQHNQYNHRQQQYQQPEYQQNTGSFQSSPPPLPNSGYPPMPPNNSLPNPSWPNVPGTNTGSLPPPGTSKSNSMAAPPPPPPPGMASSRAGAPPPPPGVRSGLPPPPGPPGLGLRGAPPPPPPGTR